MNQSTLNSRCKILKSHHFFVFVCLVSFFILSSFSHAETYKCVGAKNKTVFQDKPCAAGRKEIRIHLEKPSANSYCVSQCGQQLVSCVASLEGGAGNTDGGLDLCDKEKLACSTSCLDVEAGQALIQLTAAARKLYKQQQRDKKRQHSQQLEEQHQQQQALQREQQRQQEYCQRLRDRLAQMRKKWQQQQRQGWVQKDEDFHRHRIENAEVSLSSDCR